MPAAAALARLVAINTRNCKLATHSSTQGTLAMAQDAHLLLVMIYKCDLATNPAIYYNDHTTFKNIAALQLQEQCVANIADEGDEAIQISFIKHTHESDCIENDMRKWIQVATGRAGVLAACTMS